MRKVNVRVFKTTKNPLIESPKYSLSEFATPENDNSRWIRAFPRQKNGGNHEEGCFSLAFTCGSNLSRLRVLGSLPIHLCLQISGWGGA